MYIGLALIVLIIAAMIALLAAGISFQYGRTKGAPFYSANAAVIRTALTEAGLRPGETFYDLGAGTGIALIIAEKEFGAKATGFEISLFAYWIAKLNILLHGSRAAVVRKDFFAADLGNADLIFCFLAVRTMERVEEKLKTGLKPGARIAVFAFPLPTLVPERTIAVRGKWNLFVYRLSK